MGDLVDDLEAEGSALCLRAARYIRIKRQTEEQMRAEHRRVAGILYDALLCDRPVTARRATMSSLSIEVSVYGGTPIGMACEEACRLATAWGITVCFKFNGVECMAIPGGEPRVLAENWACTVDSKSRYPMASTHPRSAGASTK